MKTIGVVGAGAWGTAIAHALAGAGNRVDLWALEKDVAENINERHENARFLNGFSLSPNLCATNDLVQAADGKEFLILANPSLYLESMAEKLLAAPCVADGSACIGVLTKGFVPSDDGPRLILETLEAELPAAYKKNLVYIAGPSHAEEVAMGKLTGLIAASENPKNSIRFRELLREAKGLMVYSSLDVVGVQVCAAAKNVIAVMFGGMDAISEKSDFFGDNAESFLLAAGLREIQIIGMALGATHPETFSSISGVGDLDVTCRSKYGRNRKFGRDIIKTDILNRFADIDDLIDRIGEIGYLPEGAVACKYVHQIAEKKSLKLPICGGLYQILNKEKGPLDVLNTLVGEI